MVNSELLSDQKEKHLGLEGHVDAAVGDGYIHGEEELGEVEEIITTEVDSERVLSDLLVFWGFANRGW